MLPLQWSQPGTKWKATRRRSATIAVPSSNNGVMNFKIVFSSDVKIKILDSGESKYSLVSLKTDLCSNSVT